MRLLIIQRAPRLPMEDCEWGSHMIRLFGRQPRANRHRIGKRGAGLVLGGLAFLAIGVTLTILLFTF